MTIPRLTVVTLGVADLERATRFYTAVFGRGPNPNFQEISFFDLPGAWISLYPRDKLAEDISPQLSPAGGGFSGITLAYNARSRDEVRAVFAAVEAAGATVVKPPQDTFWGGFSGYFSDPDGHYWEVVWGSMFEFAPDGALRFKT